LRDYLREHLAPYKQPSVIRAVEAFPMTGSGKVLKRRLLELHPVGEP
jgi:acyl-CoA synthetase (AMP-forming)/AMP-acid ligase II